MTSRLFILIALGILPLALPHSLHAGKKTRMREQKQETLDKQIGRIIELAHEGEKKSVLQKKLRLALENSQLSAHAINKILAKEYTQNITLYQELEALDLSSVLLEDKKLAHDLLTLK